MAPTSAPQVVATGDDREASVVPDAPAPVTALVVNRVSESSDGADAADAAESTSIHARVPATSRAVSSRVQAEGRGVGAVRVLRRTPPSSKPRRPARPVVSFPGGTRPFPFVVSGG
jgi:hypothetical protein